MTSDWYQAPRRFVFSPAQWRRSLRRLAGELTQGGHDPCRQAAADLDAAYAPLREIFTSLCPRVCPDCQRPCCAWVDVKGLVDHGDLIFFAAQGLADLPAPELVSRGCAFLTPTGCRLPWTARPFACLRHVCSQLNEIMDEGQARQVREGLEKAALLRADLVSSFLEGRSGLNKRGPED